MTENDAVVAQEMEIRTLLKEELNVAEALVAANGQGPTGSGEPFPPLISEC